MQLMSIDDDVFVAGRGVHLLGAEALDHDGQHGHVVLATFHGRWNRPDPEPNTTNDDAADEIRVMFFADGATRLATGLLTAVEGLRRDPDADGNVLDGWIAAARQTIADHPGADRDLMAGVSRVIDHLAERCAVSLDPETIRLMMFTLAAVQSAHLVSTPLKPDDPGFTNSIVSALSAFTGALIARLDGEIIS